MHENYEINTVEDKLLHLLMITRERKVKSWEIHCNKKKLGGLKNLELLLTFPSALAGNV